MGGIQSSTVGSRNGLRAVGLQWPAKLVTSGRRSPLRCRCPEPCSPSVDQSPNFPQSSAPEQLGWVFVFVSKRNTALSRHCLTTRGLCVGASAHGFTFSFLLTILGLFIYFPGKGHAEVGGLASSFFSSTCFPRRGRAVTGPSLGSGGNFRTQLR